MKKNVLFLFLAVVLMVSFAACGDGAKNDQTGIGNNGTLTLKDINTENWNKVLKENFGFEDIPLTGEWMIKSAECKNPDSKEEIELSFGLPDGAFIDEDNYFRFAGVFFNQTETNSVNGNKNNDGVVVESIHDTVFGESNEMRWFFNYPDAAHKNQIEIGKPGDILIILRKIS